MQLLLFGNVLKFKKFIFLDKILKVIGDTYWDFYDDGTAETQDWKW